jgi:hypothetical protein
VLAGVKAAKAGSSRCGAVRAAVVDSDDLDVDVVPTTVGVLVFDARVGDVSDEITIAQLFEEMRRRRRAQAEVIVEKSVIGSV